MDKKEQTRLRVQRYREKNSVTNVTQGEASVTEIPDNVTPSYMKWIIEPDKRRKMERVCSTLEGRNQLRNVTLGCGYNAIPLDVVAEMLEVTK